MCKHSLLRHFDERMDKHIMYGTTQIKYWKQKNVLLGFFFSFFLSSCVLHTYYVYSVKIDHFQKQGLILKTPTVMIHFYKISSFYLRKGSK